MKKALGLIALIGAMACGDPDPNASVKRWYLDYDCDRDFDISTTIYGNASGPLPPKTIELRDMPREKAISEGIDFIKEVKKRSKIKKISVSYVTCPDLVYFMDQDDDFVRMKD